jgi:uncharacterized integral membrane protein
MKGNKHDGKDAGTSPDPVHNQAGSGRNPKASAAKMIIGGIVALLLIWFIIQNSHPVEVHLLWWQGSFPMVLVMAAAIFAGIAVWETLWLFRRRQRKRAGDKG